MNKKRPSWWPFELCQCGCGGLPSIAKCSNKNLGRIEEDFKMKAEKSFYSERLVTFEKPISRSKKWVCFVGGWDFSGENKLELMEKAIHMIKCELAKLEIEYEIESKQK